jgi:hypothetical protein
MNLSDDHSSRASWASRPLLWQILSAILIVVLIVLAVLIEVPIRSVPETGVERHSLTATNQSEWLTTAVFLPGATHCGQQGVWYSCDTSSNTGWNGASSWTTLNWSTSEGREMTFQMYGYIGPNPNARASLLYSAENASFGVYGFQCGSGPEYCGDPFEIVTNDSTGEVWVLQWAVVYSFTSTVPLV